MKTGIARTYEVLARSRNEAAIAVLVSGLDGPHPATQEASLRALLDRPSLAGHLAVFQRLPTLSPHLRAIVEARPERMAGAAGEALRTADAAEGRAACEAVVACRLYEAIPTLLGLLNRGNHPAAEVAAETVLRLADLFYDELSHPERRSQRKEFDNLRQRLTASLEDGFRKYATHGRREVVEAFLLLTKPQNVGFRATLAQSGGATDAVLSVLETSLRGGVVRLLLSYLDDPMMPKAVRRILASRVDAKFLENFAGAAVERMSKTTESLSKFDDFAWLDPAGTPIGDLSGSAQAALVQVLRASAVASVRWLGVLECLLREGTAEGRRAAAAALSEIPGSAAEELVRRFLDDPDPATQATLLRQVRSRNLSDAMSLLLERFDTPYEEVRAALREALPEFTVAHFLANVERIDDWMRVASGQMVRKIDARAAEKLRAEMQRPSPVRRRRAVLAADAMGVAAELEADLIRLLSDEDHMVRIAAASALENVGTKPSWEALRDALLDRSVIVQEAAEKSLHRIAHALCESPDDLETEAIAP